MEYIDLDKNDKPKNLDSLKGTQLFMKYPFGGKIKEYRCNILKELAIGLVQGRPSITNIHVKFGKYSAIEYVSSNDRDAQVNGFVDSALEYAAQCKGWQLSPQSSRVQYISDINYRERKLPRQSRNESMKIRDPPLQVYWRKTIICIGASLMTIMYW